MEGWRDVDRLVRVLAERQAEVLSRPQLYAIGITRWQVEANLRAGRWQRIGDQSVCLHRGPLGQDALHWAAVFQGGPRACLDGASALIAHGLSRFAQERIRVSTPRGARVRRTPLVDVRQTRRWQRGDIVATGVPRTRPAVAAVRAGLWARTDREAALVVTMAVQQRLTSAEEVAIELVRIRRDRRRAFLHLLVLDLLGGVRSLGELDFVRECRRRGLPEPTKQVLRRAANGSYYLDALFDPWDVVVEVDGIQHGWVDQVVGDALRQNDVALDDCLVIRMPLLGWRVARDEFFAQLARALRDRGYRPGSAA
jgi:very-short-patch-repair endonuclease